MENFHELLIFLRSFFPLIFLLVVSLLFLKKYIDRRNFIVFYFWLEFQKNRRRDRFGVSASLGERSMENSHELMFFLT